MNWEVVRLGFEILTFFIAGGASVYVYLTKQTAASTKRTNAKLENHEGRITKLEGAMDAMPSHTDITELKTSVARLEALNEGQTRILDRLAKQFDRMDQWLTDRAK